MNTFTHAPCRALLLLVIVGCPAGTDAQSAYVATVTELQGTCYTRDSAQAQPTKAHLHDKMRASQEVLCDNASHLTITYLSSSGERQFAPRWVAVGNASSPPGFGTEERRGGREAYLVPDTKTTTMKAGSK